jgi:hypothetical protein
LLQQTVHAVVAAVTAAQKKPEVDGGHKFMLLLCLRLGLQFEMRWCRLRHLL